MFDFRRRIAVLLLCLGTGMMAVHFVDPQRSPPTMLVAGAGLIVFYLGIYLMLRRT